MKRAYITKEIDNHSTKKNRVIYDLSLVTDNILLVDPLTQLISYESLASYIKKKISQQSNISYFLAIGDVDGLREYVSSCNSLSDDMFGHVAGNHCMKTVGETVIKWQNQQQTHGVIWLSGTFGGDEVIIFSEGGSYDSFVNSVCELRDKISQNCPRPCSFACSEYNAPILSRMNPENQYKKWVSHVDRTLFKAKSKRHKNQNEGFVLKCSEMK